MRPTRRHPGGRTWALPLIAAAAVAATVTGGLLTLRALDQAPDPEPPARVEEEQEPQNPRQAPKDARYGRKPPPAFGLPSYPGASSFHSMEVTEASGSTAFSIPRGASGDVVRFYIEELGKKGWQLRWRQPATQTPGTAEHPVVLRGTRARWFDAAGRKQLTLLALDDVQKGRTAQAVLSWAPVTMKRKPVPGGKPPQPE